MTEPDSVPPEGADLRLLRRIAAKRMLAQAFILAERLTVLLLPALAILALLAIISWFGLARQLPFYGRLALVIAAIAGLGWALWPLRKLALPSRAEADRRLEEKSGLAHQAISVQADRPAGNDPFALALWRRHQARMAATIGTIDAGAPSPDLPRRDPFALRGAIVLLLAVAWSYSWSNSGGRLADMFAAPAIPVTESNLRVDAWVTPPSYTGVAPVYLTGRDVKPEAAYRVPTASELTIRISGDEATNPVTFLPDGGQPVTLKAEDAKPAAKQQQAAVPISTVTYKLKLTEDGRVAINGQDYVFALIPDKAPTIAFSREPGRALNGALEIAFQLTDDYGVTAAQAEIEPVAADPEAVALFEPPKFPLDIPGSDSKKAKATVSRDLTEHPLSGKKVKLTLVAQDAAGNEGKSETKVIVLPQRFFNEPLAGSIAEQRQTFSLDVRQTPRALDLSDAAAFRADETIPNKTHFLLLKSTRERLLLSATVRPLDMKRMEETAKYFWDVARYIEDGSLSDAEKRLRDAQDRLSEALKRNAPDAEIAKLMQELREAMKQYLAEMAKRMQNQDQTQMPMQAQRMMRAQDFDAMLNQLENMARSGNKDEARKLLSEMQRMLNNMQTARPNNNQNKPSPMREQIDKLGKLMQDQQKLMEDTHRTEQALRDRMQRGDPNDSEDGATPEDQQDPGQQQAQPGDQQKPGDKNQDQMTAEELRQALKDLKAEQEQLQKDLKALEKGMADLGMKAPKGFGDAGKEMGESSDALGKSQGQRSADAQGRALQALRDGAGEMMSQLRQMQQQAGQNGQQGMQQPGSAMNNPGNDPLGRQSGDLGSEFDDSVKVPDQIDVQRAREILEQIRRRLGSGAASIIERQYLERLLDMR